MTYLLEIICIGAVSACYMAEPIPETTRIFRTKAQCDKALIALASDWQPSKGAFRFECQIRR